MTFATKTAVITGGASGLGLAIAKEVVRRGGRVVLADIDADKAEREAATFPAGAATATRLDVRDGDAFARTLQDVVAAHGRIDYLFNNAGVFIAGDTRHMTAQDWSRIVDINIRGVVNGVAAVYPIMIAQGFGHIVNTGSAAGLVGTPGATAYSMTKHAVVGLSTALRSEAAGYGVKVTVLCPGFVDTPIKDNARYLNNDRDTVIGALPLAFISAERCAREALDGVERNRAIVVVTVPARVLWVLYRLAPTLMMRLSRRTIEKSPLLNRK